MGHLSEWLPGCYQCATLFSADTNCMRQSRLKTESQEKSRFVNHKPQFLCQNGRLGMLSTSNARKEPEIGHLSTRTLLRFFKGKSLSAIKPADIGDYIVFRRIEGVSHATINRELACLKHMYTLAIDWENATKNPVLRVKLLKEPPGRTKFLSQEESQKLIFHCADHLKPIVITAPNSGMLLGELLNFTWDCVHIEHVIDPYIEVEMSKSGKKRFIPLNQDMVELFRSLPTRNSPSGHVFLSIYSKPLKSVKRPFQTALKKAGIQKFRFHDLRRTIASHFIMNGGDLLTLKENLGHSSFAMVQRYAHLSSAHKQNK